LWRLVGFGAKQWVDFGGNVMGKRRWVRRGMYTGPFHVLLFWGMCYS
jgi:hypothetical protein